MSKSLVGVFSQDERQQWCCDLSDGSQKIQGKGLTIGGAASDAFARLQKPVENKTPLTQRPEDSPTSRPCTDFRCRG